MLTKRDLRSKILHMLRNQKEAERDKKSKIIKEKLFKSNLFKKAKRVMFYVAFDGEVQTQEMITEAQKKGKIVTVPACDKNRKTLIPCKIGLKERFKRGSYGIKEPRIKRPLAIKYLDLVIVPGVAFDKQGNRLGRGEGYYDSFLKSLTKKSTSIGLAFDFQILPYIPVADHDASVDSVLFA